MVRAFDGTKTSACGKVDLKILISPYEFEVSFVILDSPTFFNLLLGRPWIHSVGSTPSICIRKSGSFQEISSYP